jgi:hypothetical protein
VYYTLTRVQYSTYTSGQWRAAGLWQGDTRTSVPSNPREASSRQRYAVRVGMHISTLPSGEIDGPAGASRGRNNILTLLSLNATPLTPPRIDERESLRACRLPGKRPVQARATNLGCRAGLSSVPLPHPPCASAFSVRGFSVSSYFMRATREVFRRWCHQDDERHEAALLCLSQLLKA